MDAKKIIAAYKLICTPEEHQLLNQQYINYITVQSKINSDSVCAFNCSKFDTCVNGSKLRGICKIKLNEKNCKSYDEILGYSITFD